MDLGVISIQLEVAEALNMNDITKGREGSLDKTRLWSLHPFCTLGSKPPLPLPWSSQSLELHSQTSMVLNYTQNPALGLAKMLCSGSLLCYHLLMGF